MKICKQIEDLIPLYYSGDLNANERKLVENHLDGCPTCLKFSRSTRTLLNDLKPVDIPIDKNYGAELVVNIQNRLQRNRRQRKLMYYLVPAFSSIVLMIIVGLNVFSHNSLSRQWLNNNTMVELYSDLTHSGFFSEMSEVAFEQINTNENDRIASELSHKIGAEIIETSGSAPVDDYIVATAHLTDREFESFLKEIENFTL
ncbi:MAG: zf-HC2 domain-containing protein [Candidatus Marinimicrobia bacterium]|nr:zf-HC2 domain-containing protein [Candidatus Neomarinimicrobiota bacterium]